MKYLAASLHRDWRIARRRPGMFVLDGIGLIVSGGLFYYLGRHITGGDRFFGFVVAGLAVLRLHTAVPRLLDAAITDIASGRLELTMSSPRSPVHVAAGMAIFELLRGMGLAAAFITISTLLYGAPTRFSIATATGIIVGLICAATLFAALTLAALGLLLVYRQAGAIGSLLTILMPVLAGAYFPVRVLPEPFATVASILPFQRTVNIIREGVLQGRFNWGSSLVVAAEAVPLLLFAALAAWAGTERARRTGVLAPTE